MAKRKSLSKKTRFEVFKRDNFTCQYCGAKAPEVILEIDHINPVSKGGDNSIMNLITSCFECNRGKRDVKISDNSVVEKQRLQIEELNLRRQQLEMMLQWRDGVKETENISSQKAIDYFNKLWEKACLNKTGETKLIKLVKKYGVIRVLDSIDLCFEKYYYRGNNEEDNFNNVFNKIGGVLHLENQPEHIKQIAYIRGICRNKFDYFNDKAFYFLINKFHEFNGSFTHVITLLKEDNWLNWSSFKEALEQYIKENETI